MRRILRRYITRDASGRPISIQIERLSDDGAGSLQLSNERTARLCSGCRRPVADISEMRGMCDCCRARECCVHCLCQCHVCSRRLCGRCRRGFGGPPAVTVCGYCRERLLARQAILDERDFEQATFDRYVAQQRLVHQQETLRLEEERLQLTAEAQAARLRAERKTILQWVLHTLGWSIGKIFQGLWYVIRRSLP